MNDEIKKYIDEQLDIIRKLCDICIKCKQNKLIYPPPTTINVGNPYCKNCDKSNKYINYTKVNDLIMSDDSMDYMDFGLFD